MVAPVGSVGPMRQLLPTPGEVDPLDAYLRARRPAPDDRPWVVVSMVSSLDGATAVDGRSGPLGGAADREVFRAVRALADVILVAAGTLRAESYGPVRMDDAARRARAEAGRSERPARLAVVSRSLDLAPASDRFGEHDQVPIVLTTDDADPTRMRRLSATADVRCCGHGAVDLGAALRGLREDGAEVVVCEGGPSLNGAVVEAGLVDELCLSIAPTLVSGASPRLVAGGPETQVDLELVSLLTEGDVLFGRWVRPVSRTAGAGGSRARSR
jgi:riboflavin biosynthesis pyrimidine reductase